ncbi:hypothetical protein IK146_00890 [Candidatus Saccharibacteria bacterium]|nr:hypothetical protein [Candidatus Saccharibacteria bacterium]
MLYVVNDLHGSPRLIRKTVDAINNLQQGDTLIINGDGAGARGPVMNSIVKTYYEVRRGETDEQALLDGLQVIIGERPDIPPEWIYQAVHAGMFRKLMAERYEKFADIMQKELEDVIDETLRPISEAALDKGVKVFYLPGNGEIVPQDFDTSDITTEQTVEPDKRYYQQRAKRDYFWHMYNIEYVPYLTRIPEEKALLISTHLLDMDDKSIHDLLDKHCLLTGTTGVKISFSKVIVHYPPAIAPIGRVFDFWTPNKSDIHRVEKLNKILGMIPVTKNAKECFGHIHLGDQDQRMDRYPAFMGFEFGTRTCVWVKPGTLFEI